MDSLDKKIAVLGAGGLLGSVVASHLQKQGATLVCCDLNTDNMHDKLKSGGVDTSRIEIRQLDVTQQEAVVDFFNCGKGLDGAVNCSYPRNANYGAHFFDVKLEDFNENLALHLGSSFLIMQQCAQYFERHKTSFSLVNISSIYGVVAPKFDVYNGTSMTMPVEYAAIKSALLHLSRYVAKYVANSNFRVNSVSPGGILDSQPSNFLESYGNYTLGKGMLDKEDLCGAIRFLLSDEAKFINGQNLIVDDGFSL